MNTSHHAHTAHDENAIQWLLDNGGPVIRYRTATELAPDIPALDLAALEADLLRDATVRKWLDTLKPHEFLAEQQRRGEGLGEGGHSSFMHGACDPNVEVVLPKLAQLGLRAGMPALDVRAFTWCQYLQSELERDQKRDREEGQDGARSEVTCFIEKLYSHYDSQLIVASSLALAGYTGEEAVRQVLLSRLGVIVATIRRHGYDLFEEPGTVRVSPKSWGSHMLKWELYSDGNTRVPFVHDVFGYAALYRGADRKIRGMIDKVVRWILAPEHQSLPDSYGYIRYPDGRGKKVGWKTNIPGYEVFSGAAKTDASFDPRTLVLRCWQMAHFPAARAHPWLRGALSHLEGFATERGTYRFPPGYLAEARERGYWTFGSRMGLGEDRRKPLWCELESTFWMLAIHRAAV